jgi:GAF domain-containing protein
VSSLAARLELLCEMNRRLASFASLDELLAYATARMRELYEADGCALLLVDREQNEFRFPVSSQRAGSQVSAKQLAEIRFPASQGIAGWVLTNGQPMHIPDVQHDGRFYRGVDELTGTTTTSLIAAPLRTSGGTIGVIEVLNPRSFAEGDLAFLEAVGSDVAIAHERAAYTSALRDEATGLRRLARIGGGTLMALGIGLMAWGFIAHAARALPMGELVSEPGTLLGSVLTAAGFGLAMAVRRVPTTS